LKLCRQYLRHFDEGLIDLNQPTRYGFTPFFIACNFGHIEIAKMLLAHPGIDVNRTTIDREMPLFGACRRKDLAMIKLLLNDPRMELTSAMTLLCDACHEGHLEVVKLLLESGKFDVNQPGENRQTPLYAGCERGHLEIVQYLLDSACELDINEADNHQVTPLLIACEKGYYKIVDLLLSDRRTEVNHVDKENRTELWAAARCGNMPVVKRLLASNFDIDSQTKSAFWIDKSPADIARRYGNIKIADLIDAYENNKNRIRKVLKRELKLDVREAAQILALSVLLSDRYLRIHKLDKTNKTEPNKRSTRFFRLVNELPLELQTKICNLVYGYDSFLVNSTVFELALKAVLRMFYQSIRIK